MVVPVINAISFSPSTGITNKVSNSALSININKSSASQKTGLELQIGWEEPQDHARIFDLMRWSRRVSDFHGRDHEMQILKEWADSDKNISVKLITGEGGNGKTRLAAELAELLENEGWDAGFINMYREREYHLKSDKGTLILLDYPEQYPESVRSLFQSLDSFQSANKLRILFISRHSWEKWESLIDECSAGGKVNWEPLYVGKLDEESAHEAYTSAVEKISDELGIDDPNLTSFEAFKDWSSRSSENDKALFVLGLAVHDVIRNKDDKVKYSALEIVDALVNREIIRLKKSAKSLDVKEDLFTVLLAMATIAGFAPLEVIQQWIENDKLNLKLKADQDIKQILKDARLLQKDIFTVGKNEKQLHYLPALEPDIMASYFVWKVLQEDEEYAPERIWSAFNDINIKNTLRRYERIDYDVKMLFHVTTDSNVQNKYNKKCFGEWLVQAVKGRETRCQRFKGIFVDVKLSQCCLPAAIIVFEVLYEKADEDNEKAYCLGTLANLLWSLGDNNKALEKNKLTTQMYRHLCRDNPTHHEPDLAISLNNMSMYLSAIGNVNGALRTITEAVEIYRRLSHDNPFRYEPYLAMSLNNLSSCLSEKGDIEGGVEAIKEAVEIYRHLSQDNPFRYEEGTAINLVNMSNHLSEIGNIKDGLDAIREAVEIYRRLYKDNPIRYEPDLALSLNNMSRHLSAFGDNKGALAACCEAVEIHRCLSQDNPARYESDLAKSLNNMSTLLSAEGDFKNALEAICESVEINRRLCKDNSVCYELDLALCLTNMSRYLSVTGENKGAMEASKEATKICRRLSKDNPARYEAHLALCLKNMSRGLLIIGDVKGALNANKEAVDIYLRLSLDNPARYEPELAMSFGGYGRILEKGQKYGEAAEKYYKGIQLIQPFAEQYPGSPYENTFLVLIEDFKIAADAAGIKYMVEGNRILCDRFDIKQLQDPSADTSASG